MRISCNKIEVYAVRQNNVVVSYTRKYYLVGRAADEVDNKTTV